MVVVEKVELVLGLQFQLTGFRNLNVVKEGFGLDGSFRFRGLPLVLFIPSHCSRQGKTYCMNLSAPFIMQVPPFKAVLMKTMPDVDVQPMWRPCLPTP